MTLVILVGKSQCDKVSWFCKGSIQYFKQDTESPTITVGPPFPGVA